MMVLEKLIEDAIIAKIALALPDGARIVGAWSVASGGVKDTGDDSAVAVAVAVSPRSYDSFMAVQCDFACAISLIIRRDACPDGQAVIDFTEPLFAVLHAWNADEDVVHSDLCVEGFTPGGVSLTGGEPPRYEESVGAWTLTQTFTVRGIINN